MARPVVFVLIAALLLCHGTRAEWLGPGVDSLWSYFTPSVGPKNKCDGPNSWFAPGAAKDMVTMVMDEDETLWSLGMKGRIVGHSLTPNGELLFKAGFQLFPTDDSDIRYWHGSFQHEYQMQIAPHAKLGIVADTGSGNLDWLLAFDTQTNAAAWTYKTRKAFPSFSNYLHSEHVVMDPELGDSYISAWRADTNHASWMLIRVPRHNSTKPSIAFDHPSNNIDVRGMARTSLFRRNGTLFALQPVSTKSCSRAFGVVSCGTNYDDMHEVNLINLHTRTRLWNVTFSGAGVFGGVVVEKRNQAYVPMHLNSADDPELVALSLDDGSIVWRAPLDALPNSVHVLDANNTVVVTLTKNVKTSSDSTYSTSTESWMHVFALDTGKSIQSLKLTFSSGVFSASTDINFRGFDFVDKTQAYMVTTPSSSGINSNQDDASRLYVVNLLTGSLLYTLEAPTPKPSSSASPTPNSGGIYPSPSITPNIASAILASDGSVLTLVDGLGEVERMQCKEGAAIDWTWQMVLSLVLMVVNAAVGALCIKIAKAKEGKSSYGDYQLMDGPSGSTMPLIVCVVLVNLVCSGVVLALAVDGQMTAQNNLKTFQQKFSDLPAFQKDYLVDVCNSSTVHSPPPMTDMCLCLRNASNSDSSACKTAACGVSQPETCSTVATRMCSCAASFYKTSCDCKYGNDGTCKGTKASLTNEARPEIQAQFGKCADHYGSVVNLLEGVMYAHIVFASIIFCVQTAAHCSLGGKEPTMFSYGCMCCSTLLSVILLAIAGGMLGNQPVCTAGSTSVLDVLPSCKFNNAYQRANLENQMIKLISAAIVLHGTSPVGHVLNAVGNAIGFC